MSRTTIFSILFFACSSVTPFRAEHVNFDAGPTLEGVWVNFGELGLTIIVETDADSKIFNIALKEVESATGEHASV